MQQRLISPRARAGGRLRLALLAALAIAALAVAATAQSRSGSQARPAAAKASITLALVLDDCVNPVERPLVKGAEDAASKLGFTLKNVCPNPNTAQNQISLVQDLVAQKVNAIIILPVDSSALVPAINAAVDAGVTVATTELDAPTSKRSFFYFGGTPPLGQG